MKRNITRLLITICSVFTIWTLCVLITGYIFVGPEPGINLMASWLGAAAGISVAQFFWFSPAVLKKPSYSLRILGFGLCGFPIIALPAWIGAWFPVDDRRFWATFAAIYLLILVLTSIGYGIYYKKTAGGYDKALQRYREEHGRDREEHGRDREEHGRDREP